MQRNKLYFIWYNCTGGRGFVKYIVLGTAAHAVRQLYFTWYSCTRGATNVFYLIQLYNHTLFGTVVHVVKQVMII